MSIPPAVQTPHHDPQHSDEEINPPETTTPDIRDTWRNLPSLVMLAVAFNDRFPDIMRLLCDCSMGGRGHR